MTAGFFYSTDVNPKTDGSISSCNLNVALFMCNLPYIGNLMLTMSAIHILYCN